jgi:diguanylate cyclase (GGDEF)-like protein
MVITVTEAQYSLKLSVALLVSRMEEKNMKYDVVIPIIFYICGCFYMVFGAYMLAVNVKSYVNRLYVMITSSLAIWAFAFSISISAPTAEVSAFEVSFSAFGWGVFYSLFLHFTLILTKTKIRLSKRMLYALIYIPALINIFLFGPFGYHAEEQYKMVWTDFGWLNATPLDIWEIWFIAYYLVFVIANLIVLIRWWIKIESSTRLKQQATYFLISILFPLFLGIATETVPVLLGTSYFPKLTIVFLIVPITTLFLASRKLGLLLERKKESIIFTTIERPMEGDRDRLFKMAAAIFTLGSALSFLIGYFGMKRALEYELLLSASLLLMGTVVSNIPNITKKLNIQNNIFLAVCELGFLYFMIKDRHTGGLTVWAVYTLFLLFTVILDSRIHAFAFTALCIFFQILFWITRPEVTVIIDANEYIVRIFIILLTFFTVRYLTNEYALKIKGYRRIAREQEVLENISTSFISLNTENAREKIDEMFKMADEILGFDQAFFVELDHDHGDATILNTFVKDIGIEPFPYYPGMMFKTAAAPVLETMMEQRTILICEDTTNISFEVAEKHKDYIMSRGVKSFYGVPIEIDNEVRGVFVVEYNRHTDMSFNENRLNFIKIIANIMGDAKKKTLYENMLYHFAYFDEATKLANRNMLKKRLEQMISDRKGSERIAVINIELENLRMINDTYGHSIGEQVVIKSAMNLKKMLDECCDISRTGDGDFVVVLPKVNNHEQIEECANRLLNSFSQPVLTETGIEALFVVVHMGIAVYPDDGIDAETLLKNADLARYEAENTNEKIVFYTERLESHIAENTLLTNRLF